MLVTAAAQQLAQRRCQQVLEAEVMLLPVRQPQW